MLSDEQIDEIAARKKAERDEERAVQKLIHLSETSPEFKEEFQDICDFLNLFKITIGDDC
jgi:hypothetical protein